MPRRTAVLVAAAMVLLTALLGLPASGDDGTTDGPSARETPSPPGQRAFGRTPYESRLLSSRGESVNIEAVTGRQDRPNVIVLMMDDMRDDDLQFLPNVKRLIRDQGVRFTNTFSAHPLCCPARASFFSGMYSHNHQVWSHKAPYGFKVFDDSRTLPVWLHGGGGYDTVFMGKYLNGYGRMPLPDGSPSSLRYVPPGWTDWRAAVDNARETGIKHLQGGTYRFFDTTLSNNGKVEPHQGRYQTQLFSDITQDVIRREARGTKPFFIEAAFAAPHVGSPREKDDPKPFRRSDGWKQTWQNPARPKYVKGRFDQRITQVPTFLGEADVADKPVFLQSQPPLVEDEWEAILEDYRQRVESLSVVDDEVANIFETLERTGELDNTYVMFTSDNGFFLGEHRRRQGKILPYDPSLRVPLVMRGPGIPAGEARRDPFLMIDFVPTILDAAGVAIPGDLDGVSMLDVARNGDRGWRRPIFTESGPRQLSEDTLERVSLLERENGPSSLRFSQGVRTGRYLYVEHASGEKELYDMRRDPYQFESVLDRPRYRSVQRTLAAELDRLRTCSGPSCSAPLPRELWTKNPVRRVGFDPVTGARTTS
ncbi:MAG TPA: sulfatase [Nocardioides sp.]|uniref:sulfatase family protein n=1 Tax=Nocardioides sp. TaxID=35761 RepID=UPI002D7EC0DF|nr:sulfatase [Nocardioides sp.]HET6654266.1 sulfatase [Nocardioides sp.]